MQSLAVTNHTPLETHDQQMIETFTQKIEGMPDIYIRDTLIWLCQKDWKNLAIAITHLRRVLMANPDRLMDRDAALVSIQYLEWTDDPRVGLVGAKYDPILDSHHGSHATNPGLSHSPSQPSTRTTPFPRILGSDYEATEISESDRKKNATK
ncbi:hypothetical protein ABW20_dc0105884 [Dactylellina cionopaga]|nr:hypothetical protein ABW20_dc0105884 [Dactylellina cionopaga]